MFKLGKTVAAQQIIFASLIFLIPTQLGYHIWLASSYLQGVRVDYFAPTLNLTDVLVFSLIALFILENRLNKSSFLGGINRPFVYILLGFAVINILLASSRDLALIKWIKVIELALFAIYIRNKKNINLQKVLFRPLLLSGILFSVVGIAQFISQSSLGGLLYFLGERAFNAQTPGIALANYFGYYLLRPYSTFSHPNSFAAFLGFLLILTNFFRAKTKLDITLKWSSSVLGIAALLLTLSQWVFVSLLVVFLGVYLAKRKKLDFEPLAKWIFVFSVVVSLFFSIFSEYLLKNKYVFDESFSERLYLAKRAGEIVKTSPVFGVGLNNFILNLPKRGEPEFSWRLQPVHNIFLLTFVEAGILGVLLLSLVIFLSLKKTDSSFFWVLTFILISGLADHYWLTLQQNQLILSLVLGLSSKNIRL